jgi:hypothetical protein
MNPSNLAALGRNTLLRAALVAGGVAALGASLLAAAPSSAGAATASNPGSSSGAYYSYHPLTGGLASASTTFKVPAITCTPGLGEGEEFGLYGWNNDASPEDLSVVTAVCNGSNPTYQFVVQADGSSFTENGVNPGDTIVASFFAAGGFNQATVHDLTSNLTWIANAYGEASTSVAIGAFQVLVGGVPQGDAPFGTVTFTKTQANGDYLGFDGAGAYNWDFGKVVLVQAGGLRANGDTFKLTWRSS